MIKILIQNKHRDSNNDDIIDERIIKMIIVINKK
jgi:hypothetical protein